MLFDVNLTFWDVQSRYFSSYYFYSEIFLTNHPGKTHILLFCMRKKSHFWLCCTNQPQVKLGQRAVRMVLENKGEYDSMWETVESIAPNVGCSVTTLLKWVNQSQAGSGERSGVSTAEQKRINPAPSTSQNSSLTTAKNSPTDS